MTLWNLTLWLNDYARQYPFTYMYCEYIHKVLVGLKLFMGTLIVTQMIMLVL